MNRIPIYRLMTLAHSGRISTKATGSLIYLRRLGAQALRARGRQWIELNIEPATLRRKTS